MEEFKLQVHLFIIYCNNLSLNIVIDYFRRAGTNYRIVLLNINTNSANSNNATTTRYSN
jgi:hypothetical protein